MAFRMWPAGPLAGVPVSTNREAGPRPGSRPLLVELDRLLFQPRGWFLIDADNRAVPGLVVTSLDHGLGLLDELAGQAVQPGMRRTLVGRLRPEITAVDVDAAGVMGDAVAEQLATWCEVRGLWHMVRPSGGGSGRAHVFTVPGELVDELEAFCVQLRGQYRLAGTAVDVRGGRHRGRALRPLSAPHRTGVQTRPDGSLRAHLTSLRAVLPATPAAATLRPRRRNIRAVSPGAALRPGTAHPQQGRRTAATRPLARGWSAHLERGAPPPCANTDRSTVELLATAALLRAGHDAASAWAVLHSAPAGVAEKAKERGRSWWDQYVWSAAEQTGTAYWKLLRDRDGADGRQRAALDGRSRESASLQTARVPSQTQLAVAAARDALQTLQWRLTARERAGVVLVAHTLLDRMDRVDATTVPCPLRDLELDTGLSLPTVSAALNRLHGLLGRRVTTSFDPARRESTSHTFVLDARFGDLIEQTQVLHDDRNLSQLLTPASHTPQPPPPLPPGVWAQLGSRCGVLWRSLLVTCPSSDVGAEGDGGGVTLLQLAQAAGMTTDRHADLTPSQARTTRAHLGRMVLIGLVSIDVSGRWRPREALDHRFAHQAVAQHQFVAERVARERHDYRSGVGRAGASWRAGQRAAVLRQHKIDRVRQRQWWAGLQDDDRSRRATLFAARFAALPPHEQTVVKDQWAARRAERGSDSERERHEAWISSLDVETYQHRSIERAFTFALLPRPLQVELVHQWAQHRSTWDVPRGPTVTTLAGLDRYTADLARARRDQQFTDAPGQDGLPFDESSSA
jgi:hypothetical protein